MTAILFDPYRLRPSPRPTGTILDLLATDDFVEGSRERRRRTDDPSSSAPSVLGSVLCDLLSVDESVDLCGRRSRISVSAEAALEDRAMASLYRIDRIVERSSSSLSDPSSRYRPADPYGRPRSRRPSPMSDDFAKKNRPEGAVLDLLAVDELVDGDRSRSRRAETGTEVTAIESLLMALLRVDVEVSSGRRRGGGSGGGGALDDLLAIDRLVDGGTHISAAAVTKGDDDLSAVMDLLTIDREIDAAKGGRRSFPPDVKASYETLLAIDRQVDGVKPGGGDSSAGGWIDPFAAGLAALLPSPSRDDLEAVSDLLRIDREVDGGFYRPLRTDARERAVDESMRSLLAIDMLVDAKRGREPSSGENDDGGGDLSGAIMDLLAVDMEIDAAKGGRRSFPPDVKASYEILLAIDRQVDCVKPGGRVSSAGGWIDPFVAGPAALLPSSSPSRDDLEAVSDLLKIDRLVGGASDRLRSEAIEESYAALLLIDRRVDVALPLPPAPPKAKRSIFSARETTFARSRYDGGGGATQKREYLQRINGADDDGGAGTGVDVAAVPSEEDHGIVEDEKEDHEIEEEEEEEEEAIEEEVPKVETNKPGKRSIFSFLSRR